MIASTWCSAMSRPTSASSPHIALDEPRLGRDRPVEAGRQIVEHDDVLAGIDELPDHVAADIAGAAGDQDCSCRDSYAGACV